VPLFNARSVGAAEKRTEICNFLKDQNIVILFPTEACLTSKGDEAKCADMCPAGTVSSLSHDFLVEVA